MRPKSRVGISKADQLRSDEELKSSLMKVDVEAPGEKLPMRVFSGVGYPRFTSGLPEIALE